MPKRKSKKQTIPITKQLKTVSFGIAIGLTASFAYFMYGQDFLQRKETKTVFFQPQPKRPSPTFTFHNSLENLEVVVAEPIIPPSDITNSAPSTLSTASNVSTPNTLTVQTEVRQTNVLDNSFSYIIQAASFIKIDDADKLKARLILGGFQSYVTEVVLEDGIKRYRVHIGPFETLQLAHTYKARLHQFNLNDTLILRRKNS